MKTKSRTTKDCGAAMVIALCVTLATFAGQVADEARRLHAQQVIAAQPTETVHVCEGDTIWGIARAHHVDGVSTRELVQWVRDQNGLSSAFLSPGQTLLVPLGTDDARADAS